MYAFDREIALRDSQAAIGRLVREITLLDENGHAVEMSDYSGKPLIVSLVFTSCHHICPTLTRQLSQVVAKGRSSFGQDKFSVLTIGFDTAVDSPERMKNFRKSLGINDPDWHFAAISATSLTQLAEDLGFVYQPSSAGFDHLLQTSVIDHEGRVYRQIYGMTYPTPALLEPLKELVYGQPPGDSWLDYIDARVRLFCTVYDPATDNYQIDVSVFIGTGVGLLVSLLFGRVLFREWRRSLRGEQ